MNAPGVFYRSKPTRAAYGGIGTGNEAFLFPWNFPAQPYTGFGVAVAGQLHTVGPDQSYFMQRVTNAPVTGFGKYAGATRLYQLLTDLYANTNNTVSL